MSNNKTTYQNQAVIRGLLKGEVAQHRVKGEFTWYDYDLNRYLENEYPFGPWNSADCHEWRIKPKTTEITVEITVTKTLTIEGVKDHRYKAGEQQFFIEKYANDIYETHKYVPVFDNNDEFKSELIFFETEEAMNKAYEQIINAQKGL